MLLSKPFTLAANTPTELLSVPEGHQVVVNYLLLSNTGATDNTLTLSWTPNGASAVNLVQDVTVPANSFLEFGSTEGNFIVMNQNDTLDVTTEAASTFSAIVTCTLTYNGGGLTNYFS